MYEGKLVRLRACCPHDAEAALEMMNDEETRSYISTSYPLPMTLEEERQWMMSQSSDRLTFNFAIESLSDGVYLGGCGINRVDTRNRVATVGICIAKPYWGKGFGTDAMDRLLYVAFEGYNLNRVQLFVYDYNQRAYKSYIKNGFREEGRLRQQVFRNGEYHDEIVMGILRAEWLANLVKSS